MRLPFTLVLLLSIAAALPAAADISGWRSEWPRTDFGKSLVSLDEILSGGPPKDGIPAIDAPRFVSVAESRDLTDRDPVVSIVVSGEARAYPLRVLVWHEIVNDRFGDVPVAVTYCPLCNAAVAFERSIAGRELSFGVTGKLRHSDMIMYDQETETWWQQYSGEAIVGTMVGTALRQLPARLESFGLFRERHPKGKVLVPTNPALRPYGSNPYVGYEDSGWPFLYKGPPLKGITALERVVVVGDKAWTLDLVKARKRIESDDLVIEWIPGQASALDAGTIAEGRDVGNIVVRRRQADTLVDVIHHVTFAFVLNAFRPDATIHTLDGDLHWGR